MNKKQKDSFSAKDLLIVMVVIVFLLILTFVYLKPIEKFIGARNEVRKAHIDNLSKALIQYEIADPINAVSLRVIPRCPERIDIAYKGGNTDNSIDLDKLLVDGFIKEIPKDPLYATGDNTGYTVCRASTEQLKIEAREEGTNNRLSTIR